MNRTLSPSYHATFTSDPRSVALARNAVASFARLCGFPDREVADIRLAAGEAAANAAQYGSGKRGGGFSVDCRFEESELRVEVQDSGSGFDDTQASSGFGTIIMRTLMNSISYSKGGTRVRLVKRMDQDA